MWMYNLALPTTVFLYLPTGVEKNNDTARASYRSSNRWDSSADIIRTEIRMEKMTKAGAKRAKRKYTKRKTSYWEEGIETSRQLQPRIGITQQTDSPILR